MTALAHVVRFTVPRPAFGWLASTTALLLALLWHPAWLAPVLVIALTAVWIVESRRRLDPTSPADVASNSATVSEALEDVRVALVD